MIRGEAATKLAAFFASSKLILLSKVERTWIIYDNVK